MKDSKILALLIVGLVAFGVYGWLMATLVLRTQADTSQVSIRAFQGDNAGHVAFSVQPTAAEDKISGVDLVVTVENGSLDSWENCSSLDDGAFPFTELLSETGKTARYSCVVIKDKDQLPGNAILAGDVTCIGDKPAVVTVDTTRSEVSGPVEGTIYDINSSEPVSISCDGTGGGGGDTGKRDEDVLATFDPSECVADKGEACSYNLNIESNPDRSIKTFSGLYVRLNYDDDILSFNDISENEVLGVDTLLAQTNVSATPTPDAVVTTVAEPTVTGDPDPTSTPEPTVTGDPDPSNTPAPEPSVTGDPEPTVTPKPSARGCKMLVVNEGRGYVEYLYTCLNVRGALPKSISHNLTFDAIGNGRGSLKIGSIQAVGPGAIGAYTVYKDSASYTIGDANGKGNIEVDLKLRLQCVVKKPKRDVTVKVNVGLGDGKLAKNQFQDIEMHFNDDGHLEGKVSFEAPAGSGYKLMPKYEYGMRKKICDNNAKEDYPGAYSCDKGAITLKDGLNKIDLSQVILLSGDIPPDEQDGISNAKDQALVRSLIGKRTDEAVELADINYDGTVNQVDHACMIAALAVRWDEE